MSEGGPMTNEANMPRMAQTAIPHGTPAGPRTVTGRRMSRGIVIGGIIGGIIAGIIAGD